MALAETLKVLRKKRRLTQQELADAAGTTVATIGLIEIGKRHASLKLLGRIAEALGTTVPRLLS